MLFRSSSARILSTTEVREEMAGIVVDNILALLDGRRPPNIVNPDVLP